MFGNKSVAHKESKKRNSKNQPDFPALYLLVSSELRDQFPDSVWKVPPR